MVADERDLHHMYQSDYPSGTSMPVKFVLTSLVAVTYILYSYVALPKGNTAICVLQRNRSHDLEQVFQVAPLTGKLRVLQTRSCGT